MSSAGGEVFDEFGGDALRMGEEIASLRAQRNANADLVIEMTAACNDALNVLIGCCVPAGGCDDRKHMADVKAQLRAALAKVTP